MELLTRARLLALLCFAIPSAAWANDLQESLSRVRANLKIENANGVPDVYGSLKQTPEFKGLRRVRPVLPGLVYRGGGDNKGTSGPDPNKNPLRDIGEENLCRAGFGHGFYLYATNYAKAKPSLSCQANGSSNKLLYLQKSVLLHPSATAFVLKTVHEAITSGDHRPIYLHCWNGLHASGYIAAVVLRQFCKVAGDDAVTYWDRNADQPAKYPKIRKAIRDFAPLADLSISEDQRAAVCPSL